MAETAPEAIAEDKDSINGVQQLQLEATAINQNFSQQVRGVPHIAQACKYESTAQACTYNGCPRAVRVYLS